MFQSTSCNSSPSMSRIPINEVHFVSEVYLVVGRGRWVSQECQRILINEVYFVSKQACTKRAREREREGGRERRRGKNSNQRGVFHVQTCQEFQSTRQPGVLRLQACQEFQSTRCTSSPSNLAQSERERERESEGGREGGRGKHVKNSKNYEVYFVSKQVCAKRVRERERGREKERQAWQEFQSTRCTLFQSTSCNSSPSMSRIPINEVYFVSKQACASEREREREREREIGRERGRGKRVKNSKNSNQRGVLRLQPSLCKASERERGGEKERQA